MAMDSKDQGAEKARAAWHQGHKYRKQLLKLLEQSKEKSRNGLDTAHLDAVDQSLEQCRLACVTTIFLDFEYAAAEHIDDVLWGLHVSIRAEYRRLVNSLRTDKRVVEQRKVEAKYGHFLRIAQKFYKGYIQHLSARYEIKELKRVAKSIQAEDIPAKDVILPEGDLGHKVLVSCYQTLIHLGDLSRYRVEAKQKKTYDTAQAFYSVAHDLMPESGRAYHQMGIVSQDENNRLDLLYHIYRALAVKEPHPKAREHLEGKFKAIKGQHASPRGKAPSSAHDALILWFFKLHALFYKGEPVSTQYNELEREVIHRLSSAIKDSSFSLSILKMALVNMSACHTASSTTATAANKTTQSSFFQYTLHFNARFILKICEVIESAFESMHALQPDDPTAAKQTGEHQAAIMAVLPVLRVYGMWIAGQIPELFRSPLAPRNVLPPLMRSLAKILTFFCREVDANTQDLDTCPYLLQEDIEIRGLRPLDADRVPLGCLSYYKRQGVIKPHLESTDQRLDPVKESRCRLFDILRCGYILAKEVDVPLAHPYIDGNLVFIYEPDSQADEPLRQSVTTQTTAGSDVEAVSAPPSQTLKDTVTVQNTVAPAAVSMAQESAEQQSSLEDKHMEQMDKTVADMLSPFMDSPGSRAERQEESSYGMHTASANDVAQQLLNLFQPAKDGPTPYYQSLSPGTYHSSPWGQYISSASPGAQSKPGPGQRSASVNVPSASSPRGTYLEVADEDSFNNLQHQYVNAPSAAVSNNMYTNANAYGTPGRAATAVGSRGGIGPSGSYDWPRSPLHSAHHFVPPEQASPAHPLSSGYSAFTNMSSVYQGTPAFGTGYTDSYRPAAQNGTQFSSGPNGQKATSPGAARRQTRQDRTQTSASTYDFRIFEAAMQGKK